MNVPFVDLKPQYAAIKEEVDRAIAEVIATMAFIKGPAVERFEQAFAAYCEAGHCVAVGNGTDALFVALKALGIGPGDEVLVPANSFIATAEAVTMTGAQVVFVDADEESYCIDLQAARAKLTPRTKAVIPVHLYGRPADLTGVEALAREHGLKVVQDCAQAHGARYEGLPLAGYGDLCCYSFFPGKNLGAYGDAGAIVCNDEALARRCRMFANHGRADKYDHEFEGVNSRMDGIQGAVLGVKLKYLEDWTEARRRHAGRYDAALAGMDELVPPHSGSRRGRHVYHLYVVQARQREALRRHLQECGIATGIHYPIALPELKAYRHLGHRPEEFPVASRMAGAILSLPMYPELGDDRIDHVVASIRAFYRGGKG